MPPNETGEPRALLPVPAQPQTMSLRKVRKRGRDAREFLPAALEVLDTPASPIGRTLALALAVFFAIAVLWALIGRVDIVAIAQGRIVPAGGVKLIQPLESGTVRAIYVQDGQHVVEGELLVELDSTDSEVDRDRLLRNRDEAAVDVARLTVLLDGLAGREVRLRAPAGVDLNLVTLHAARLQADLAAYRAALASYDAEEQRQSAEQDALIAEHDKITNTLPIIAEREAALAQLVDQGLTARPVWLDVKAQLITTQHDELVLDHRVEQAAAAAVSAMRAREKFVAETVRQAYVDLIDAQQRLEQAEIALRTADNRAQQRSLTAPVDGTVQQLAVHTVGGVVSPAEVLMVIVPDGDDLQVEAFVLNRDKGFVVVGQDAVVKLEAFPFTKYGTIAGKVVSLSGDAIEDDRHGLVYAAHVALAGSDIHADGKDVPLVPGMAVTVEIKTGERRLIDYLLSPLLRYEDEALRER